MTGPTVRAPARRALAAIVLALLAGTAVAAPVAPTPGACQDGVLPGGALSRICGPATGWNGARLVFAIRRAS